MSSVALTDHGRAGGLLTFKKECEKVDVKPILGIELYVAPESHLTKEKIEGHLKTSYHLTVLAQNEIGLKNIFRLASIGWTEGFYYKPRCSNELIKKYSEGLIVLSGCGSSRLSIQLLEQKHALALQHVLEMREIFKDNFYLEVQNHGLDWQILLKDMLFTLAEETNIPIVTTQDSHYQNKEDSFLHNKICQLAAGDLAFDSDQSWFKSEHEIKQMFTKEEHFAIEATEEVASKCNCDWQYNKTVWPVYDLPKNITPEQELENLTWKGFRARFGAGTKEYEDRIKYELDIINKMGFATYFLVVQDFIDWAKKNNIMTGPGRGSAGGSLICYCVGITEVDPIKYNLYFERFLNPSRQGKPDYSKDIPKNLNINKDLTAEKLFDILQ